MVANTLGLEKDREQENELVQEAAQLRSSSWQDGDFKAGKLFLSAGDIQKPEYCAALVQEAVKHFGKLDICVANAGIFQPAEFLE